MPTALVVMARYPEIGRVKTRLARAIGDDRAHALYRAFLRDIEARFAGQRRTLVWAFHPPQSDFAAVVGRGRCLPQVGGDLGERLHNCFRSLCREGFDCALIIGGDAPHVREAWLDEAEHALARAEVVLGPSADGGYYLIGMRQPHDLFSGIEMSTPRVLAETLAKAQTAGLRVHLLPESFDVDEESDVARLRALLVHDGSQLPCTAALLRGWEQP
ncbi:MAG: TIGR04282 family arsenosugar biosynthesis glycosyltransferase [Deltaproteobacteria bacterium]|nr:TIGR04282 family arsenosugar biosynthesis glycosyltransferase [Deltaproteobacteria bacterium]